MKLSHILGGIVIMLALAAGCYYFLTSKAGTLNHNAGMENQAQAVQAYAPKIWASIPQGNTSSSTCSAFLSQKNHLLTSVPGNPALTSVFYSSSKQICFGYEEPSSSGSGPFTDQIVDLATNIVIASCTHNSDKYGDTICKFSNNTWDFIKDKSYAPIDPLGPNTNVSANTFDELKKISGN